MAATIRPSRAAMDRLVPACHEAVKLRLRAPGSARFSGETVTGGPVYYRVAGAVDAQNGFGALLRYRMSCEMIREQAWRALDVRLTDWP